MTRPAPRLSICIATLNRADLLRAMLESIAVQWTDDLELVLVDGASTDATPEVAEGFRARLGRVTYVRLPEKGGVDRDYHKSVVAATGSYCWLLSDDDVLAPGAVAAVLRALATAPSLVIVNTSLHTADLGGVLDNNRLGFADDRLYTPADYERLFVETANHLSYIGAVVIDRALWLTRNAEHYFGSWFVHVGVIFQAPLPADTLVLAQPRILVRAANASWSSRYFEIWMVKWPDLIWSFAALPTDAKRAVFAREPWRRLGALLICRAKAAYDLQSYRRWVAPRLAAGPLRWLAQAIAVLPGPLVNALALSYFRVARPQARADMLDFRLSPYHWSSVFGHRAS